MKFRVLIVIVVVFLSCRNNKPTTPIVTEEEKVENVKEDFDLEIYDFEGFKQFLNKKDDKTYVINFWATWCGPCVKELPYFEKLNELYKSKNVEVILVSLDFPHVYESKLKPFIKKKNLKSKVIVLNDSNENKWISEIDTSWSGSIPATIIYKNSERKFFEKSFTYKELLEEVKQF